MKIIKLKKTGVKRLKTILKDLNKNGKTGLCPAWNIYVYKNFIYPTKEHKAQCYDLKCNICMSLFPKIEGSSICPCYSSYSTKYLIKRLKEIINFNQKL